MSWVENTGLTPDNLNAKLGFVANVKEDIYGAVGDGVTDDRASVVSALNALPANGGAVLFPAGVYRISSTVSSLLTQALHFMPGARLVPDSGATVSISGPVVADAVRIFAGDGTITFSAPNTWDTTAVHKVKPEWWGTNGNASPYDTAAIQAAIDTHLPVEFSRDYFVSTVTISGSEFNLDFSNYALKGVSAVSNTDCVLAINCSFSNLRNLHVDAQKSSNYSSAVRWFATASQQAGWNHIDGLWIENALVGLVIGSHPSLATIDSPLSESQLAGLKFRATERCLITNQPNGKITLISPQLVTSKNDWGSTFSYARSYCFWNYGYAELAILGGSIQKNESSAGSAMIGYNFRVEGSLIECRAPHWITGGLVTVRGNIDSGGPDVNDREAFVIAAGSTNTVQGTTGGQMVLDNVFYARSSSAASNNKSVFVNGSADTNYRVVIRDSLIDEWPWSYVNDQSAPVVGCRAEIYNTTYRRLSASTATYFIAGTDRNYFTSADPVGRMMSGSLDTTSKGSWTWAGDNDANCVFSGNSSTPPPGIGGCITLKSVAGKTAIIDSPTGKAGFWLPGGRNGVLRSWVSTSTAGGSVIIDLFYYDWQGNAASTSSERILQWTTSSSSQSAPTWMPTLIPFSAPTDASYGAVRLYADGGALASFSDIRLSV